MPVRRTRGGGGRTVRPVPGWAGVVWRHRRSTTPCKLPRREKAARWRSAPPPWAVGQFSGQAVCGDQVAGVGVREAAAGAVPRGSPVGGAQEAVAQRRSGVAALHRASAVWTMAWARAAKAAASRAARPRPGLGDTGPGRCRGRGADRRWFGTDAALEPLSIGCLDEVGDDGGEALASRRPRCGTGTLRGRRGLPLGPRCVPGLCCRVGESSFPPPGRDSVFPMEHRAIDGWPQPSPAERDPGCARPPAARVGVVLSVGRGRLFGLLDVAG